jgi:hypothetical protein
MLCIMRMLIIKTMATKPKVGVLVMALLEDDYNRTVHMRPLAQKAADRIGAIIGQYAETICPPLVEEEYQAEAAAHMFNRVRHTLR